MSKILLSQRFLPEIGGSITWVVELFRRWPEPVTVITHRYPQTNSPATDEIENLDIKRVDLQMRNWGLDSFHSLVRYWRMLSSVSSVVRADRRRGVSLTTVFCTHAVPELVSLLPLKLFFRNRLFLVSFVHGEEILACASSRQLEWLQRLAYRSANLLVANSENTARLLERFGSAASTAVINPGVDTEEIASGRSTAAEWRAARGFTPEHMVLLTVGRLETRKNHRGVLAALAELRPEHPNLRYVIIGTGPESDRLRGEILRLNLEEIVFLEGAVSHQQKLTALHGCDVFIMPSIQSKTDLEGFGVVFLEAGACRKPSIAGNTGGQPEAVLDEHTGLVVDGASVQQIKTAIVRLISDVGLRNQLGTNAERFAREHDWQEVLQKTVGIVNERLSAPSV